MLVPAPSVIYLRAAPVPGQPDTGARNLAFAGTIIGILGLVAAGAALWKQRRSPQSLRFDEDDIEEIDTDRRKRRLILRNRRGETVSFDPETVEGMADSLFALGLRAQPRFIDSRVVDAESGGEP